LKNFLKAYVRIVEGFGRGVGRVTMLLVFAMMGVLLWSSINRVFTGILFSPSWWPNEMSQFLMVAYFLLGGAYSMQLGDHVRMDLMYGAWSDKTKACFDAVTILFLIFYLVILLDGGIASAQYAIKYNEVLPSLWRPALAPIKIIMCFGIVLMLLQATASFIKDVARIFGEHWGYPETPSSDAANGGPGEDAGGEQRA